MPVEDWLIDRPKEAFKASTQNQSGKEMPVIRGLSQEVVKSCSGVWLTQGDFKKKVEGNPSSLLHQARQRLLSTCGTVLAHRSSVLVGQSKDTHKIQQPRGSLRY